MKSERKSLQATKSNTNREMEPLISNVVFFPNEGVSRHRRNIRSRPKPDRTDSHGRRTRYRGPSREAKALHRAWDLPGERAALESFDDRIGHVALVPRTSRAGISESVPQTLLHSSHNPWRPRDGSGTSGDLHRRGGRYKHSPTLALLQALEAVDACGADALVDCAA